MNNAYLFIGLEGSAPVFQMLVDRLPREVLDMPTHSNRFTPKEVIAHLADWEPRLLERIKTAKTNPGATVEIYDEGELAVQNRYGDSDIHERLDAFLKARSETTAFLRSLSPADWDLKFHHPEQGPLKIEDQAAMMVGHDQYHLDQLSEVLVR